MLGVASAAVERSSGDPLSNLERLIKENSEIQAGNFQLQHEMRAALAERNVMLSDLCEVVNKEKELVEILADRCKKVEQQHTVMEWISRTLKQVTKDRTEKVSMISEAESDIAKHVALIDDLRNQFSELQIRKGETQSRRDSTSASIRSVQSEVTKAIGTLDETQAKSWEYKSQFSEMLAIFDTKNAEIHSLQQAISQAFLEIFYSQLNTDEQIEELELHSKNLENISMQLDVYNAQLVEVKAQIRGFRQLIQNNENIEVDLLQMKDSISSFCQSLETSNNLVLFAVNERKRLTKVFIQSLEATIDLENRYISLQEAIYRLRESHNDSIETSVMYENQIACIMQEVVEFEGELHDNRTRENYLISEKKDLLQRQSQAKVDFYNTVTSQIVHQQNLVRKLNQYNEQCRSIVLKLEDSNLLVRIRQDMMDLADACTQYSYGNEEEELQSYEQAAIQMCAEMHRLTSEIEALDFEFSGSSLNFHQLSEEYHDNMAELKTRIKEKDELNRQLEKCKAEAEQSKVKFAMLLSEKVSQYQKQLEEEQTSDIRDLGSIPKELLDQMNNRKQQEARRFNDRMNEIQSQIDAALHVSQKSTSNPDRTNARSAARMKKLMPVQSTHDPWILD